MINRYGLVPLAFALFVFVIFFISLVPSPHKSCIDRNLAVLNNLDEAKIQPVPIDKPSSFISLSEYLAWEI